MKTIKRTGICVFLLLLKWQIAMGQVSTPLESFSRIDIFGKLNVRLEKSDVDSLLIESGTFDVANVNYKVNEGVLSVKLLTEFPPAIKVNVTIKFKQINALDVGGGARVYNYGSLVSDNFVLEAKSGSELDLLVNIDSASVKVNKGAFVRLRGENRYMHLKTSTGGDFRSTKMSNQEMYAILNGGSVEILSSEDLQAIVRFGASLKYVEQPKKIKRKERFGGSIGKLEDF